MRLALPLFVLATVLGGCASADREPPAPKAAQDGAVDKQSAPTSKTAPASPAMQPEEDAEDLDAPADAKPESAPAGPRPSLDGVRDAAKPGPGKDAKDLDPLSADLAELERLEKKLAAAGVAVPALAGKDGATPVDATDPADMKCEDVCQLTEAICALEGRICTLAESHDGDRRYADACDRAGQDCKVGTDACTACSP